MKKLFFILVMLVAMNANGQWASVSSGLPSVSYYTYSANGKVYSANQTGFYYSTNNGIKWVQSSLTVNLSVILQKNSYLITAGSGGIFVSTNEGINWTQTSNSYYSFTSMISFGSDIFASNGTAILKSTNNGYNWSTVYGAGSNFVTSLTVKDNYIFAGIGTGEYSPGKVIYSSNNGVNWSVRGLDSVSVSSMNTINGIIFAGTTLNGLYKSSDNGISWVNSAFQGRPIYNITVIGADIYLSTIASTSIYEFYKSTDNGTTWNLLNTVPNGKVISLSKVNNVLILGLEYGGVHLSSDNGLSWTHYLPPDINVYCFYKLNTRLFAGVSNGIYYSGDGGLNWIQSKLNQRLSARSMTSIGTTLYAGIYDYISDTGGVYISSDNGINWTKSSLNRITIYALKNFNSNLYAGAAYSGIYKSTNNGVSWNGVYNRTGCVPNCFYQRGSKIFTGMFRDNHYFLTGLYFTTNEGVSWDSVMNINSVMDITANSNYLFAACNNVPGVLRSSNEGANWSAVLADKGAWCILTEGNYLFAGTTGNGIYMSSNNGDTWVVKNEGLTGINISALITADGYIYAGNYDHGISRRLISDITSVNQITTTIPSLFSLSQNYPNPFNPVTKIKFDVALDSRFRGNDNVVLKVYDVMGREVQTLVSESLKPGTYEASFDGSHYSSGVYFYKLITDGFTDTKKMLLIK